MYVITGTSGTGKTTLLASLRALGYLCFDEPIRRVLEVQLRTDGDALPSKDPKRFIRAILTAFEQDYEETRQAQAICFFDRGIPDAAAYATRFGVDPTLIETSARQLRYSEPVFVLEPWREIFVQDELRGKTFGEYEHFHQLIIRAYSDLGYSLVMVPRAPVETRAEFIMSRIGA
ncbi:MAG: AAA family ATPase [Pseudomonadales bacterium]|nr:AAA family ATPase [Pseudomonadales bacterium]